MEGHPFRDPPRDLAPPPRRVPAALRFALTFGGFRAIAWVVLAVTVCFATVILGDAASPFRSYEGHARGRIVAVHLDASSDEGDRYAVDVRFTDERGGERVVRSFHDRGGEPGDEVTVEYDRRAPWHARLAGGHEARHTLEEVVIVCCFLVIAGLVALTMVWLARRDIAMLRDGVCGRGRLVARVDGDAESATRLTFEYTTRHGRTHRFDVEVHDPGPITDDAAEPLVYHPQVPGDALLLDNLPGAPLITPDGALRARAVSFTAVTSAVAVIGALLFTIARLA